MWGCANGSGLGGVSGFVREVANTCGASASVRSAEGAKVAGWVGCLDKIAFVDNYGGAL